MFVVWAGQGLEVSKGLWKGLEEGCERPQLFLGSEAELSCTFVCCRLGVHAPGVSPPA